MKLNFDQEEKEVTMISAPAHLRNGLILALVALSLSGCKSQQDKAIEQAKIEAAKTGQPQQVVTTDKNGNTVTTTVQPPAQGQKDEVVTTTVTPKAAAGTPAAAPAESAAAGDAQSAGTSPAPASAAAPAPAMTPAPVPAPKPEIRVSKGTALAIRINQRISVKTSQSGDRFTGQVVEPVTDGSGNVVIPKGSPVRGVVAVSHERGKFKGASELELRLTSLSLNGTSYPLTTHDLVRSKKGKGKRSTAFIGGGTGLGLLLGGVAGGGKGALIGGLAGAGAGTAGAGLTGNKDLVIQAETIVRFKLADDLVIQP
ncbi:hypothetical protein [Acidicapsa ligni]|uniref:hypothetical protein n=1 Tax=Acidicapsa ligni TaxID=542300 RepID=UPI0021E0D27E|nr:hypothetical protein [Acidicapsa ligni]